MDNTSGLTNEAETLQLAAMSKIIVPTRKLSDREKHVALTLFIESYKGTFVHQQAMENWEAGKIARACVRTACAFVAVEEETELPQGGGETQP